MSQDSDFSGWIRTRFRERGAFTALIVLIDIAGAKVEPVASTYAHVIGDEMPWRDMKRMLDSGKRKWNAVVIFPAALEGGGPLDNDSARETLRKVEEKVLTNRLAINDGHFFDARGRRMTIDEVETPKPTVH